jgi:hypothetical protein
MAFADNPVVRAFVEQHGEQGLPLTLATGDRRIGIASPEAV